MLEFSSIENRLGGGVWGINRSETNFYISVTGAKSSRAGSCMEA